MIDFYRIESDNKLSNIKSAFIPMFIPESWTKSLLDSLLDSLRKKERENYIKSVWDRYGTELVPPLEIFNCKCMSNINIEKKEFKNKYKGIKFYENTTN